ncbi:MAG TPA: hypothetical protein VIJ51_06420 [Solirubrobacteraceae bacterium]
MIGGPAGRAGLCGVVDRRTAIIAREWAADDAPDGVAAADDRLLAVVGLTEDGGVRAAADLGGDPRAPVVDHLHTDRARRQEGAHEAAIIVQPSLHRTVAITGVQLVTPIIADVSGDRDPPVVPADDALTTRQRDQDPGHQPILISRPVEDNPPRGVPPTAPPSDGMSRGAGSIVCVTPRRW